MASLAAQVTAIRTTFGFFPACLSRLAKIAADMEVRFDADEAGEERIWLGGENVTDQVRTEECGRLASTVAAIPEVRQALALTQGNVSKSSKLLGISRPTLYDLMNRLAVKVDREAKGTT